MLVGSDQAKCYIDVGSNQTICVTTCTCLVVHCALCTGLLEKSSAAADELPKITIESPSNEKTLYLYEVCSSP